VKETGATIGIWNW